MEGAGMQMRIVIWSSHDIIRNILEFTPVLRKDGRFDKNTQEVFNEAVQQAGKGDYVTMVASNATILR